MDINETIRLLRENYELNDDSDMESHGAHIEKLHSQLLKAYDGLHKAASKQKFDTSAKVANHLKDHLKHHIENGWKRSQTLSMD